MHFIVSILVLQVFTRIYLYGFLSFIFACNCTMENVHNISLIAEIEYNMLYFVFQRYKQFRKYINSYA